MADTPESKPPFWSSLPGIFTGLGGLIVAVTGLITALYTTGVIGPNANSNAVPPVNIAVTPTSTPIGAPSPSPSPDNDQIKHLTGRWEVIEERSERFGGDKITWAYDATVTGDELMFKGRILSVNGEDPKEDDKSVRSTYRVKMMGLSGLGEFRRTEKSGVTMSYPATIRLDEDPNAFHGTIDIKGQAACSLTGRKL
jgi:hypothetical protein